METLHKTHKLLGGEITGLLNSQRVQTEIYDLKKYFSSLSKAKFSNTFTKSVSYGISMRNYYVANKQ